MDVLFRGVKVRVDEKWTWGEGGQKRPKMGGRPMYKPPCYDAAQDPSSTYVLLGGIHLVCTHFFGLF